MQHDEVIWQLIGNKGFCSYKSKTLVNTFCRNPYNVTGMCNRTSCPLANSRYATIQEHQGRCFLYIKTIERAHLPRELWEKVKLSENYAEALKQISEHLLHFPKTLVHRNKQRLTKIVQYLIRMRKLKLKVMPELVRVHKKVERREKTREVKALAAAQLEKTIEKELLERLHNDVYDGVVNFPAATFEKILEDIEVDNDTDQMAKDEEREMEDEGDLEDEEQFVAAFSDDDDDDDDDGEGDAFGDDDDDIDEVGSESDQETLTGGASDSDEAPLPPARGAKKSAPALGKRKAEAAEKPPAAKKAAPAPKRPVARPSKRRPVEIEYETEDVRQTSRR